MKQERNEWGFELKKLWYCGALKTDAWACFRFNKMGPTTSFPSSFSRNWRTVWCSVGQCRRSSIPHADRSQSLRKSTILSCLSRISSTCDASVKLSPLSESALKRSRRADIKRRGSPNNGRKSKKASRSSPLNEWQGSVKKPSPSPQGNRFPHLRIGISNGYTHEVVVGVDALSRNISPIQEFR